jgi:hypothetical protein
MVLNRITPLNTLNCLKEAIIMSDKFNDYCSRQGYSERISLSEYNYSRWFELSEDSYSQFMKLIREDNVISNRWHMLPDIDVSIPRASSGDFITALLASIQESIRDFLPCTQSTLGFVQPQYGVFPDEFVIALHRFQVESVLASHGNLDHLRCRAGALDSDAYATEVLRKEFSSMRPREKLASLLARYSNYVHGHYVGNKRLASPIFIVKFINAEISSSPEEMGLLFRNMKHMNVPNLFFLNINDLDEQELEEIIHPNRRLTRDELRSKLNHDKEKI